MFTTHTLLGMILEPDSFIKTGLSIPKEKEKVRVDFVQFLNDNSTECLLPPQITLVDINEALTQLAICNGDTSKLDRLYVYFLKILYLVNIMLVQRGYPNVKVMPTINDTLRSSLMRDIKIGDEHLKSWIAVEFNANFNTFFNGFKEPTELWKVDILGSIFHDFPNVLNTLNPMECLNKTMSFDANEENKILQMIYLAVNYDLVIFPLEDGMAKKDVMISNANKNLEWHTG
jgi:hypothetical protein